MSKLTYRDAVGKALEDSMREEPRLIVIGQNIAAHALKSLADRYGVERVRDTSISESAMVGMAVGAAMKGLKVVVMIAYADIASVCHMAIVQSAAKLHYLSNGRLNCPVIIRLPIARFRGHGPEGNEVGVSWFYNVPDLNIAMPGSAGEAYWNFREALERPTPTLFFEDRSLHGRSAEVAAESRLWRADYAIRRQIKSCGRPRSGARRRCGGRNRQRGKSVRGGGGELGVHQTAGQRNNFSIGEQYRASAHCARRAHMVGVCTICPLFTGRIAARDATLRTAYSRRRRSISALLGRAALPTVDPEHWNGGPRISQIKLS